MVPGLFAATLPLPLARLLLPIWGSGCRLGACSSVSLDELEGREEPSICLQGAGKV